MKKHIHPTGIWIAVALMALMVACNPPKEKTMEPMAKPSVELAAIDSLMWQQPDSALMCLIPYFDTCYSDTQFCVSTATAYDRHYAHLLLSELLYKNDYEQTNRLELQQAVAYFDSLMVDTRCASDKSIAFFAARAHYINGVGYYENDSIVQACAEYLITLEIMENHFEEKELVGHKARFMAYTYNRLGDMFSEQFMMEPAIDCYENALFFCKIEPTSPQGVSNILYRLGKQYNKMGEMKKAREYYGQAIEEMPSFDNLSYRDMVSTKALSDYQLGLGMNQTLNTLRQILAQTDDKGEQMTRFLSIGAIYFEEKLYDTALFYLRPVFENKEDVASQIQAAEYLRNIFQNKGCDEKANEYARFLANHTAESYEDKVETSKLDDLFRTHLNWKKEKKAAQEKRDAVLKTVKILVPIAFLMAVIVILIIRRWNKRKLAEQDAEAQQKLEMESKRHEEVMEAAHRVHRMEQAAISGRLKRSNEALRELKDQIKQQENVAVLTEQVVPFTEEPICRLIMERVNEGRFKSKVDYVYYKDYALDKQHLLDLRVATDRHFGQFTTRLKKAYPELTKGDLDYCCLYLLGLTDADIAALMQRAYNTVIERNGKLKKIFGEENTLSVTLRTLANDSSFV